MGFVAVGGRARKTTIREMNKKQKVGWFKRFLNKFKRKK